MGVKRDPCAAAVNFLVGQVLKREPRANPVLVRKLVEERLERA